MTHPLQRLLWIAVLCVAVCPATAAITTITFFNANQIDILSLDPTVHDTAADTDSDQVSGNTEARASGTVSSPFQTHELSTSAITRKNASNAKSVSMQAARSHVFDMRGVDESALWYRSETLIDASSTFNDVVSLVARDSALPHLLTVEYFFRLTAYSSHIIDIAADQQPLYRLEDRIRFNANAGGLELAPVEFDMTFYDVHTRPPVTTEYSVLEDDVNFFNKPLIPEHQQIQTIQFELPRVLEFGNIVGYVADFNASMVIESNHRFLNDGPGLNFFLRGEINLNFNNSADVLGMLVRDETGAIRTDIDVTSAEGVLYPLLTAPITNAPPPGGTFILSPVAVSESGLGTYSADVVLDNIINHSGLAKPMVSGLTLFDVYLSDGDRPAADSDYHNYWQSMVSFDGAFSGTLDFDLGDEYVVDRLAFWNGTLENIELLVATSPDGPWQSAGSFTLPNQNPLLYSLIDPEVIDLPESVRSRYLRVQVLSTYPYLQNEDFDYAILRELALSVLPVPEPDSVLLSLMADPASLFLSWPASAEGFQPQSATTLADGGNWQDLDVTPALEADHFRVTVDREQTGAHYFRLLKP